MAIPDARRSQLERALRATLDSAAHRIDPWVTGFAWQRLKEHSLSPRRSYRLGAYGWVDGPFLGQPGPTAAGRLHTPSANQTLAAIILRDKFLSAARSGSSNTAGGNPWEMTITSGRARLAEEIADEVRLGFHIYEIVGRHVEQVVGTHQGVEELRTSATYAMRPERRDPYEVCNGIAALRGLLAGDPAFPVTADQQHSCGRSRLPRHLRRPAAGRRGDAADQPAAGPGRETMDAAAGFGRPPTFEFPDPALRVPDAEPRDRARCPTSGRTRWWYADSPLRWAEPSVTAFVSAAGSGRTGPGRRATATRGVLGTVT